MHAANPPILFFSFSPTQFNLISLCLSQRNKQENYETNSIRIPLSNVLVVFSFFVFCIDSAKASLFNQKFQTTRRTC